MTRYMLASSGRQMVIIPEDDGVLRRTVPGYEFVVLASCTTTEAAYAARRLLEVGAQQASTEQKK